MLAIGLFEQRACVAHAIFPVVTYPHRNGKGVVRISQAQGWQWPQGDIQRPQVFELNN